MDPMLQFFETCVSGITELNLTAFHFPVECDVCDIVASTLPEIAAWHSHRVETTTPVPLASLARGCASLQHLLDFRLTTTGFPIPS
ncbi:hypothetical protein MTO96_041581 [Rhipicephalus appendiculatus]